MQTRNVLAGSTILGSLIALVAGFEGYRTDAYRDTGGVWTICYGETKGVKRGDTATKQQCDNMLIKSLLAHNKPFESLPYELPDNVHLATLDWAYNVGTANATSSTLWQYLRGRQWEKACNELPKWRFVANQDCSIRSNNCWGVYQRRLTEQKICLGEITGEEAARALGVTVQPSDRALPR
ncbi:putative lysozyme [Phage vB_KsaM-C1]|nr:putative lysozyme [Phage vB_KsaM-C1]